MTHSESERNSMTEQHIVVWLDSTGRAQLSSGSFETFEDASSFARSDEMRVRYAGFTIVELVTPRVT